MTAEIQINSKLKNCCLIPYRFKFAQIVLCTVFKTNILDFHQTLRTNSENVPEITLSHSFRDKRHFVLSSKIQDGDQVFQTLPQITIFDFHQTLRRNSENVPEITKLSKLCLYLTIFEIDIFNLSKNPRWQSKVRKFRLFQR